ncbi:helix-turn-helix domain-containing protein [Amycolatopsis acidiphila]|uniref:Helix-turn-helix transcriptional regulator n=1 Tax=Amycolatopsis acidiphila TaxID=715473 RepID=A0A558A7B0_9PSEU|nr:helix-turn-helix domain-containing protein [Amycolatopsis acidiphila]TVT20118.1 helix-turn-helix transcriptional regulator [Amycolatopsis acidiphila]UIJ62859.1 helix-turn-helix domain-containing protein [Amycolatopsis acidiphila]GHG64676.1 transcriptional regulator [Amycolatopsis acidiphila]
MTELPPRRRIRDAELMRALAHPLRAALLNYLLSVGPRTASECATAVDSSASNCSWHLRQLAQWGLVERVEATDGRERPWRAVPVGLDLGELGEGGPEQRALEATWLREDETLAQRYLDTVDDLEPQWQRSASLNGYSLRLTADELEALTTAIDALVRPYVAPIRTDAPAEAKVVHASWRAFLRIDADGRPSS